MIAISTPVPLIRTASPADLPAILAIYNDAGLNSTASYDLEPSTLEQRAAWFEARTRQGFPVIVAEEGSDAGSTSSSSS